MESSCDFKFALILWKSVTFDKFWNCFYLLPELPDLPSKRSNQFWLFWQQNGDFQYKFSNNAVATFRFVNISNFLLIIGLKIFLWPLTPTNTWQTHTFVTDKRHDSHTLQFSMTVHVPGSSVSVRKPRWKQLLLPEIPASRYEIKCL